MEELKPYPFCGEAEHTVIRCCECVYWGEPNEGGCAICSELSEPEYGIYRNTKANDFCSWGEKK